MIIDRLAQINEQAHAMRACEWANSRERTDITSMQLYETKQINAELVQQNRELLIKRRARLKEFLATEAVVFEQQLNAMGKAFCRDPA